MNLVQRAIEKGGKLAPLVIKEGLSKGTGLMNPSIFIDDDGEILVNLRHVNYTLFHAEGDSKFPSKWGPLAYLHPEKAGAAWESEEEAKSWADSHALMLNNQAPAIDPMIAINEKLDAISKALKI
jgi:hypothetical protein